MSRQTWVETLMTAEADGPTLTAAATASALPTGALYTLPANYFDLGKQLRVMASGRVSTVITTPGTFRFLVQFAGVTVFDSLAILPDTLVAYVTVGWWLDILLTCRAIGNGTSANLMGQGKFTCTDLIGQVQTPPKAAQTAILPWNSAPAVGGGFNSTVSNLVDLQFTQNVDTGSITLHEYCLQALN